MTAPLVVIDASVWLGWLLPLDAHHASSRLWLMPYLAGGGRVAVPTIFLAEIGGVVARRTGDTTLARRAVSAFTRLPGAELVPETRRIGILAAALAIDLRLRGADAVYIAVAAHLNASLVTWDQEQLTRGAAAVVVQTPTPA